MRQRRVASTSQQKGLVLLLLMAPVVMTPIAEAQTVPTELLDISIEDLFEANIVDPGNTSSTKKTWRAEITYTSSEYNEYFINSSAVTYDDVLFSPGQEPRTDQNYPVVPTVIRQDVKALHIANDLTDRVTLRVQIPFVTQSTDHISVIPGYDEFNISSDGLGDIVLVADTVVQQSLNSIWRISAGLSMPTGSIDEEGDTPRAPGNQQLPYTMQLGSGTWDLPILVSYQKFEERFIWGLDGSVRWRTGRNDRDYRLGNTYSLGVWSEWQLSEAVDIGVRADFLSREKIEGGDDSLTVPVPGFPYPAPVVDPTAFGGEQIDMGIFATFQLNDDWRLRVKYERPLWLNLNGPQSALDQTFSIGMSTQW